MSNEKLVKSELCGNEGGNTFKWMTRLSLERLNPVRLKCFIHRITIIGKYRCALHSVIFTGWRIPLSRKHAKSQEVIKLSLF